MKKMADDRIMVEAYKTERDRQFLIEQIIKLVEENPQLLLEDWKDIFSKVGDVAKNALGGYAQGYSQSGSPWGGAAGALGGALQSEPAQQWLNTSSQGAQSGTTGSTAPALTQGVQDALPAQQGGMMSWFKNLISGLDFSKLQKLFTGLQTLLGKGSAQMAGVPAGSQPTQGQPTV